MSTTATSSRLAASPSAAPGTSAPVLEFLCLFTHDLRRKQKRWQDGRLKYHTFNRRVMAYDDRGNFIGDMHWRFDWDFDAGEEIQLERGGVIVQVSDCVGQQSQDLSELVDKRIHEREARVREKEQRRTSTTPGRPSLQASRPDVGLQPAQHGPAGPLRRHRPLTAVIGTPTGHHGRAVVPSHSPFERRRGTDEIGTNEGASRPVKRRRHDDTPPSKLGYAQSLFGTTLTLSGAPPSSARMPSQPVHTHVRRMASPPQAPPPPTPEPEAPRASASTSSHNYNNGARRSPLRVIDERRTNSGVVTTQRALAQKVPDRHALPRRTENIRSASSLERGATSKPPPGEVMDLTLSDEDSASSTPTVIGRSPDTRLHRPGNTNATRNPLDGSMPRNRLAARPERLPLSLGSSIEAEMSPAQPEAKALEKSAQRTELRLKSRRKRGLLVVSEQAIAKPTRDIVTNPLPMKSMMGACPKHPRETVQRQVEDSPNESPVTARASDTPSERSTVRRGSSVTPDPGQHEEGEGHLHEAGARGGEMQKMQGEGDQGAGSKVHGPAGKGRRKTKRGGAGGDTHPAGEPVGESHVESSAQRRSRTELARRQNSVPAEQPDNNTAQHAMVEATTAAPPAGPRFVKLLRKGVRSKELIGFVFNDANVGSGNGSYWVGKPDRARTDDPEPYVAPPVIDHAENHRLTALTGKDTEPAGSFDGAFREAAPKDQPTVRTDPDLGQSILHRPRSPLQHLLPAAESERAQHGAQGSPADETSIDAGRAAETRAREATRPVSDVVQPAYALGLPDEELPAGDTLVGQSLGRGSAAKTATLESSVGEVPVAAPQEPRKLVNPATRGRKAALKSHAAGQVPQSVLPPDVGLQTLQLAQRELLRRTASSTTGPITSKLPVPEPPKIKMTFPGFVSAKGGGPWSREAHDLLETRRPG